MTREEAIRAMLDGKKVFNKDLGDDHYCYHNCNSNSPFLHHDIGTGNEQPIIGTWFYYNKWEIYEEPKPKKRHMTREEVLGFVCNTPGIVVRYASSGWNTMQNWSYEGSIKNYEYAYIDKQGNIGEPHKFMVEDD